MDISVLSTFGLLSGYTINHFCHSLLVFIWFIAYLWFIVYISVEYISRSDFLGHRVGVILISNSNQFSKVVILIFSLPLAVWDSPYSISLPSVGMVSLKFYPFWWICCGILWFYFVFPWSIPFTCLLPFGCLFFLMK